MTLKQGGLQESSRHNQTITNVLEVDEGGKVMGLMWEELNLPSEALRKREVQRLSIWDGF